MKPRAEIRLGLDDFLNSALGERRSESGGEDSKGRRGRGIGQLQREGAYVEHGVDVEAHKGRYRCRCRDRCR